MGNKLFTEIEDNLEAARKAFLASSFNDDNPESLRSTEDAKKVLSALSTIYLKTKDILSEFPSLDILFEKEYGPLANFESREAILETSFIDDYLFPIKETLPIEGSIFSNELLNSYIESIDEWWEIKKKEHTTSQDLIRNNFNLSIKPTDFKCACNLCNADYRTKLRDQIFNDQIDLINRAEEELFELIITKRISDLSDYVHKLRKNLDKNIHKVH